MASHRSAHPNVAQIDEANSFSSAAAESSCAGWEVWWLGLAVWWVSWVGRGGGADGLGCLWAGSYQGEDSEVV